MLNYKKLRDKMVKDQLVGRDITDKKVLKAMRIVPREKFVPHKYIEQAYDDNPLPIGSGQTISQPYIVAKMCSLLSLSGKENVLDIGVGSGYQAAVLAQIAKKVTAVDIKKELVINASKRLKKLGCNNVEVFEADGTKGYPANAPYDAIKSAAVGDEIPDSWKMQLAEKGRIVAPVRTEFEQRLVRITKTNKGFKEEIFETVRFVPLLSKN